MNIYKSHGLVKSSVTLINSDPVVIKGLGSMQTASIGRATIPLKFCGIVLNVQMIVMNDDSINYDMILGYPFKRGERISVDMCIS
jgi:hypothetical protein